MEEELLAWAMLGAGGCGLILVYWLAVALEWCWRKTTRIRKWHGGAF